MQTSINDENAPPGDLVQTHKDRKSSISSTQSHHNSRRMSKLVSKVFGDLVVDDEIEGNNSLCYSPSPLANRQNRLNRTVESNTKNGLNKLTPKSFNFDGADVPPATITTIKKATSGARRSPLRPNLLRKTQTAIDSATKSVNETINNARRAKKHSLRDKTFMTARIRDEWRANKEEASAYQAEAERVKREVIELISKS